MCTLGKENGWYPYCLGKIVSWRYFQLCMQNCSNSWWRDSRSSNILWKANLFLVLPSTLHSLKKEIFFPGIDQGNPPRGNKGNIDGDSSLP